MDAIKSVENEVDKVLDMFSTCRGSCNGKIDQLVATVEKSKQELINSTSRKYFGFKTIHLSYLYHYCLA